MKSEADSMQYWRSIEQIAAIEKEFPGYDAEQLRSTSRRSFLKLMAASLALSGVGLSGCRRVPVEKLAPYTVNPRDSVPGVPDRYATQFEIGGVATGLLVTCYDGRPIKIEGNPSHPFSWTIKDKVGAADAFAQASVLELYDPARGRAVAERRDQGRYLSTWDDFVAFAGPYFTRLRADSSSLTVLAEPASGPTAQEMKRRFLETFPKASWHEYEALSGDAELAAARRVFGRPYRTVLHLDNAKAIVLLDADVLGNHLAKVRYAADWAATRRSADAGDGMSRVHMADCGFSATGSLADERLPIAPDRLEPIAEAIAANLNVRLNGKFPSPNLSPSESRFVERAVADLKAAGKNAVVAAGAGAPTAVHALAMFINRKLGAFDTTVTLHLDSSADQRPTHFKSISDLAANIAAGKVGTLVVIGGNPAYDAPADLDFPKLLATVGLSVRLGLYDDETSRLCTWYVPRAHYLETWNDARALDGTPGVCQPLIEPLFGGKSNLELLALMAGDELTNGDEIVRRTWEQLLGAVDFEKRFRGVLEAGAWLVGAAPSVANPPLRQSTVAAALAPMPKSSGPYLRMDTDSRTYDGRFANNAWLQETPDPLTKLVWENALVMSRQDAEAAGLAAGDWAVLKSGERLVSAPVFILPGQAVGVMTLSVGYGRTAAGPVGDGLGASAYGLRDSLNPYFLPNVKISKGDGRHNAATTQNHHIMDAIGRRGYEEKVGPRGGSGEVIREATLAAYQADPHFANKAEGHAVKLQLFEPPTSFNTPHAWGMSVDLNACIGCNACAVACQSENNIPVVGREQVMVHRQMNWIRVDRYFKGELDGDPGDVEVVFQPVMCQHCENAPCEQVCPATATVHDTEGLNTMVYNRCIGTRYCSNNCAYKVRRFNYFDFHSKDLRAAVGSPYVGIPDQQQNESVDPIRQMAFNPEVTVRMRGVMEKCTYCVQRIHAATTAAKAEGRPTVSDGEVLTACQQTCPTQAIKFGNLNEPRAEVTLSHDNRRAYELLGDLNTRPRTKYLAKLRNPSPGQA